ncbi:hypothetical protein [Treponema sp.]
MKKFAKILVLLAVLGIVILLSSQLLGLWRKMMSLAMDMYAFIMTMR